MGNHSYLLEHSQVIGLEFLDERPLFTRGRGIVMHLLLAVLSVSSKEGEKPLTLHPVYSHPYLQFQDPGCAARSMAIACRQSEMEAHGIWYQET